MSSHSEINNKSIIGKIFGYFGNKNKTSICSQAPKTSETETNESGYSSLQNTISENSQPDDQTTNSENSDNDFYFDDHLEPVCQNEIRRVPKENYSFSSTDSEIDYNLWEIIDKNTQPPTEHNDVFANEELRGESGFEELNQSLLKALNSPRKIKLAYTLTVNDLEISDSENHQSTRDCPSEVFNQIYMEMEQENYEMEQQNNESPCCSNSANQQPRILNNKPLKNPRRSLYDNESPGNSLSELSVSSFSDNSFVSDMTEQFSKFWIKCCDLTVSLDVNYKEGHILRLQYQSFLHKSCDTRDLHFGIDNHKFSLHDPLDLNNISTCMPQEQESSKYWFLTGDTSISFTGKYLSSEKILRIFKFLKATVEESSVLSFGVDDVEFSNVSEFWNTEPKLSMENARPHPNAVTVSDLDSSDSDGEDFTEDSYDSDTDHSNDFFPDPIVDIFVFLLTVAVMFLISQLCLID